MPTNAKTIFGGIALALSVLLLEFIVLMTVGLIASLVVAMIALAVAGLVLIGDGVDDDS